MKRGPIIHGILLIAVLAFAYQTWTREKKVEPKTGKVEVWSKAADSLQVVLFETKDRTLRIERKSDDGKPYLWGKETRVSRRRKPKPKPAKDQDAGPIPAEPEEEIKTSTREFPAGDAADELFANFAKFRALRDLGELTDAEREEYKLAESTDNITAIFADGPRSLILGGRIYGSSDRYVLDTDNNHGYAVAGTVLSGLSSGETALRLKNLHAFDPNKVASAEVNTGAGVKRDLVRTTVKGPKGDSKGWADAATPAKADQTLANFFDNLAKLRPSQFMLEVTADTLVAMVTIEYRGADGKTMGRFELFRSKPEPEAADDATDPADATGEPGKDDKTAGKDAKAAGKDAKSDAGKADPAADKKAADKKKKAKKVDYYVRTERTRVFGKVGKAQGDRVAKDLEEIFAAQP